MTPTALLNGTLTALLAYNATFLYFLLSDQARMWKDAFEGIQAIVIILESLAVAVLFVDLVLRYDDLHSSWRAGRVVGVGACAMGLLFKWFVLYLQLSYLVD